jgi:hypothetical protein
MRDCKSNETRRRFINRKCPRAIGYSGAACGEYTTTPIERAADPDAIRNDD